MSAAYAQIEEICNQSLGRSQVFRSGSHGHLNGIRHHYESSAQNALFSVEPGSAEDLSAIMAVIKERRVPFAVKGGGHATNPEFSSTTGVQISMSRFNKISHDAGRGELTIGAGCVFDEVYKFIRAKRYNIVGGGGSVGVGGWFTGGGYSLKTNRYGLGIDNIVQVQVVLPHGAVVMANDNDNSDLFWAIRGGGNNFGIATEFVVKTYRQGTSNSGLVYGGLLAYDKARLQRVKEAIVTFMAKKDLKATIVAAFRFYRNNGIKEFTFTVLAFYDDNKPDGGPDPFQDFLDIPHHGELAESSYTQLDAASTVLYDHIPAEVATMVSRHPDADFITTSFPSSGIAGISVMNARARWGNIMVSKYTLGLINVVEEEARVAKQMMEKYKGRMVVADIWPFLETMVPKSRDTAWPHMTGVNGPLLVYFMWEGLENDEVWIKQMKAALGHIHKIALKEQCTTDDAPVYCNTTLADDDFTTPRQIYRGNLTDLSALRKKFDPHNVMSRTGGFRIPHGDAIAPGRYNIKHAVNNAAIGVDGHTGAVEAEGGNNRFNINRPVGETEEYIMRIGAHYIVNQDNEVYCEDDEPDIWNIVNQNNEDYCEGNGPNTWKIVPKSRKENQFEYSIVNAAGTKRWVLDDMKVKCVDIDGEPGPEALWRFTSV